jgi:hypothetical protein
MDRYEQDNWAVLEKRYGFQKPQDIAADGIIEVFESRTGAPTAKFSPATGSSIQLHSAVDPVREAKRIVANTKVDPGDILIIQGFGLGYLVEALLEELPEHVPLVVIEPDWRIFFTALRARDLRDVLGSARVYLMITENVSDTKEHLKVLYGQDKYFAFKYIALPAYMTAFKDYFDKLYRVVKEVVNSRLLHLNTAVMSGVDSTVNSFKNLPCYVTRPGVKSLFNRFSNVPAIIVAAGPSLDKNIDLLHEAKGKAILIAVGTAAKALQKKGIQPDFIMTVDPHILTYEQFKGIDTTAACLITETRSNWNIVDNYYGPIFVSGKCPVSGWFNGTVEDKGATATGGSVANNAMTAAYAMGANPIVLVGQDLSFSTEGRTHAQGTVYEKDRRENAEHEGAFYVKANDGGQVLTVTNMHHYLRFFEDWFRNFNDRTYINATEGGAFIEGTAIMPLRDVLREHCTKNIDIAAVVTQIEKEFAMPSRDSILQVLETRLSQANEMIKLAEKSIKSLEKLTVASRRGHGPEMYKALADVKKAFQTLENDEYIVPVAETFFQYELHGVINRTYKATYAEQDDINRAINDYKIYYTNIRESTMKVKELIEEASERVRAKMEGYDDEYAKSI